MQPRTLSRRAALLLPLAAAGCSTWDDWFGDKKTPLPGVRVSIRAATHGLLVDNPPGRPVSLPPAVTNAAWPQPGGDAAHTIEHPAAGTPLKTAWTASIGAGGGYRAKVTAQPVAADGRIHTMDSGGVVSAFDIASGHLVWRTPLQPEGSDSTNVGGGISLDAGTLYAASGFGEVLAIDAATGKIRWRKPLPAAARSAPAVAEGKLFVATLDSQVVAFAAADGTKLWAYQAQAAETALLGLPAPAYDGGLIVAGFGSGELACLRAGSGAVTWTDSIASVRGRTSVVDLSAIRGMPAISGGRVYAAGLGGLLVCIDLRSGRRLWERETASQETPFVCGDWIFMVSTDQQVAALHRDDGAVAWVTQLPQWENAEKQEDPIGWSGPVLAGDRLVLGGTNKTAALLDPIGGKLLGTQDLAAPVALAPMVVAGTLFIVLDDGTLQALR